MSNEAFLKGIQEVQKLFGQHTLHGVDEYTQYKVNVISSGSLNLDDAVGIQGFPRGRITLLSGLPQAGKTFLALMGAKQAQRQGGSCLFIDGEHTFSKKWASQLGIDTAKDKLVLSRPETLLEAFTALLGKPKNSKRRKEIPGILHNDNLISGGLSMVILDSIDSLQPPITEQADLEDQNYAPLARFLTNALLRLVPAVSKSKVAFVIIAQARTKIGQLFGDPRTIAGGNALQHYTSLWIDTARKNKSEEYNDSNELIGHTILARVKKNKLAPPDGLAAVAIRYTQGVNLIPEIPDQAVKRGIITPPEGNGKIYEHPLFPDGKINGMTNVVDFVLNNKAVQKQLLIEIKKHRDQQQEFSDEKAVELKNEVEDANVVIDHVDDDLEELYAATQTLGEEKTVDHMSSNSTDQVVEGEHQQDSKNGANTETNTVKETAAVVEDQQQQQDTSEVDLVKLNIDDLKAKAKKLNIRKTYSMSKQELIEAITQQLKTAENETTPVNSETTPVNSEMTLEEEEAYLDL